MTTTPTRDALFTKLLTLGPEVLANLVIDTLVAAGASSEWGGETPDAMLEYWQDPLAHLDIPWVGDAGESFQFWVTIAKESGMDYDEEEEL